VLVIPYDNPTGQFYDKETLCLFARLCVKYNMWMISDEAYRELYYEEKGNTSIWGITDREVPGIEGRRISIDSASKVWNACGLRTGALITDNGEFHEKSVAENTFSLCPNAIGQYIFGALAHESHKDLNKWYKKQRNYYIRILTQVNNELKQRLPGIIVSIPQASIYSVIDVRTIAKPHFDALEFVMFCARKGSVKVGTNSATLLVAPMSGFYQASYKGENPGKTQMRIAYVETPEKLKLVPLLFAELFKQFEAKRS
jgi:aspartate aminotransferase